MVPLPWISWLTAACERECPTWYPDLDHDGFGEQYDPGIVWCGGVGASVHNARDCDDDDPRRNPDEQDVCNGIDDDCDGVVDPERETLYLDLDLDGVGGEQSVEGCPSLLPDDWVFSTGDCDDANPLISPNASEWCNNGIDDDCDGAVDDADPIVAGGLIAWADADGDGQGDGATRAWVCATGSGWSADFKDCEDSDPTRFTGSKTDPCPPFVRGPEHLIADWPAVAVPAETSRVAALGDLDGDGLDDLAVVTALPTVELRAGGRDVLAQYDGDPVSGLVRGVGDVTGDGRDDLALHGPDALWLFAGPVAAGAVAGEQARLSITGFGTWRDALNGGDELWLLATDGIVVLVDGSASGTVDRAEATATLSVGVAVTQLGAADLDGDGLREMIVASEFDDTSAVDAGAVWIVEPPFTGDVDGELAARTILRGEEPAAHAGQLLAAGSDLDGDGKEDLVVAAPARWVAVFTDPLPGEPLAAVGADTLFVSNAAEATQLVLVSDLALPGDLDGDGAPDLAISAQVDDVPLGLLGVVASVPGPVARGTVDVAALAQWRVPGGRSPFDLASGDYDGDGRSEAAAWSSETSAVYFVGQ